MSLTTGKKKHKKKHRIQEHLLYALNAHPNNWPTLVQNRALHLLRSGEATSFPALLRQILDEVRKETALEPRPDASASSSSAATAAAGTGTNGSSSSNGGEATAASSSSTVQVVNGGGGGGSGSKKANGAAGPGPGEASNLHQNTTTSLAIPTAVVEEALKVTKDALASVVEFEDRDGEGDGAT